MVLGAATLACAVADRESLVGRYERRTGRGSEEWELRADGSCRIGAATSAGASEACEWHLAERDGSTALAVEVTRTAAGGSRDRTRYQLTPRRVPGGRVTIPLGSEGELRKLD